MEQQVFLTFGLTWLDQLVKWFTLIFCTVMCYSGKVKETFNIYLQEKQWLEPKGEKGVENLLPNIYMLGILLFNKRAASSW